MTRHHRTLLGLCAFLLFSVGLPAARLTLFIDGENIYARTEAGDLFSILDDAAQPLMMMGEDIKLRQLIARERPARRRAKGIAPSDKRGASRT